MKHIFALLLMVSPCMAADLMITKEFCDRYVIDHEPAPDVNYNPADQKIGPPADINGPIQIQVPKTFKIPVHVDISRFLGVPAKVTAQNHQTLTTNITNLNTLNNQLIAGEAALTAQQVNLTTANTAIQTQINTGTPNTAALNAAFTQVVGNLQNAVTTLTQNQTRIQQATGVLSQNTGLLQTQYNLYEQNAIILDKNNTFKDATSSALGANQGHVNQANQQLSAIDTALQNSRNLLNNTPLSYQTSTTFADALSQLSSQVNALKTSAASLTQNQATMTGLSSTITNLDNTKIKAIDYADLGEIEVNADGRITFNGQPLYSQEEYRIKQACKQLRNSQ